MLAFSTLVSLLAATTSLASPVLEDRSSSSCVTYASGFLTTSKFSNTGKYHPFTFDTKHELVYYNGGGEPIFAQFQTCTPNYAGAPNNSTRYYNRERYGRVYVPKYKNCLAVNGGITTRVTCLNSAAGQMGTEASIPQDFEYKAYGGSAHLLFWVGGANVNNTRLQDGCEGSFGYQHDRHLTPILDSKKRVKAICNYRTASAGVFAELHDRPSGYY